ncbi:EEF1A lysine methyltransferase 1 [Anabrus simplex]|uniref:EEF1A lysine methyltransferase 1 n=1 Tax=Anabrus simplex TaxID=316456 RepID=UPI0035A3D373
MSDSDDDIPQLSAETLAALKEFYDQKFEKEEMLKAALENSESIDDLEFDEDWQLSQFWYDDNTALALAKEAARAAGDTGSVALISCPTLFNKLKKLAPDLQVTLFEYDRRFAVFGEDFILYDYRMPLDIPRCLAGSYSVVIADPPFLSEECLSKTAITVKYLAKDKIILCSGAVMEDLAKRLLDVRKCLFRPQHKNNLANEFLCFANYDLDEHIPNPCV